MCSRLTIQRLHTLHKCFSSSLHHERECWARNNSEWCGEGRNGAHHPRVSRQASAEHMAHQHQARLCKPLEAVQEGIVPEPQAGRCGLPDPYLEIASQAIVAPEHTSVHWVCDVFLFGDQGPILSLLCFCRNQWLQCIDSCIGSVCLLLAVLHVQGKGLGVMLVVCDKVVWRRGHPREEPSAPPPLCIPMHARAV